MPKTAAGLLMYRWMDTHLEVLLVHPGGPFWANKDVGAWTIPKGEVESGEDELSTARREFEEETGFVVQGTFVPLGTVEQKGGKTVAAWAVEGDCDPATAKSNTFSMEWPPKSRKRQTFPEIDRVEFFRLPEARKRINEAQVELIDRLERIAGSDSGH